MTPSIWDYVHQYGRTYHRYMAGGTYPLPPSPPPARSRLTSAAYPFPNDQVPPSARPLASHSLTLPAQPEQDRLDMQHAVFKALFNQRNYYAPLKRHKMKRMLDIGCGTGKWCLEMGMSTTYASCLHSANELSPPSSSQRVPQDKSAYSRPLTPARPP